MKKRIKMPGQDHLQGAKFEAQKGQRPRPLSNMPVNVDESSKDLFKSKFTKISSHIKKKGK